MAINNPYIPGDPYSYDLKWIVAKIKEILQQLGTLDTTISQEIIVQLQENAIAKYMTVAEMLAADIKDGSVVMTMGYHEAGDQGAMFYLIKDFNPSMCSLDYFLTMDNNAQIAIPVVVTPYVTPEMFGAYGDGTEDDTDALVLAFDQGLPVRANKTYHITTLDIPGGSNGHINKLISSGTAVHMLDNYSDIYIERINADVCMVLGEKTSAGNHRIKGKYWDFDTTGIKINPAGTNYVTNNEIDVTRIRAKNSASPADYGIYMKSSDSAYANANVFNVRAVQFCDEAVHMEAAGSQSMNNNTFNNLDPEDCTCAISMTGKCNTNYFDHLRTEEFAGNTLLKLTGSGAQNVIVPTAGILPSVLDLSGMTGPRYYYDSYAVRVMGALLTTTGGIIYEDFKIGMGDIAGYIAPFTKKKNKYLGALQGNTTIDLNQPTNTNFASSTVFRGNNVTLTLNESFGYQRLDTIYVEAEANQIPVKVVDANGHVLLNITSAVASPTLYRIYFMDRYYALVTSSTGTVTMTYLA